MTTGIYRSDVECLRADLDVRTAQLARARDEIARLGALLEPPKPATTWGVPLLRGPMGSTVVGLAGVWCIYPVGSVIAWVAEGPGFLRGPIFMRLSIVMFAVGLAWCRAFVRRVSG